ncbi:DUF72 domain-containing protein [Pedobacter deserti]|uniref:DUF72 domain-containing protein n=1 Tax=Pedobacter deserti TaxID=2817382 RepID=UPI00210DC7CB|nr:DUF72 domain-containing protein [Pedobacter sp. SYSU D00382]
MITSIGCSGFHYKHWVGDFYPEDLPQKKWFEFYCEHFKTLELNVTFYRFPRLPVLKSWYEQSPDNFLFAVKAPRSITHYKKMTGASQMISDFYLVVENGLKEKLGCTLWQFPPNFTFSEERLSRITGGLDKHIRNVVEFRHESWWKQEVWDQLAEHRISFCGMSHPDFPDNMVSNTDLLYYRMHGGQQLYASEYSKQELDSFANNLKMRAYIEQAFIYFNNDVQGYAVTNAKYLQSALQQPVQGGK